jgi:ribosomal protein L6P/L9E
LKLDKIFYNYFLKIKNLGNFFFIQYRVYGLGFRIKYSSLNNSRSLCFEIGYGHGIYYILPLEVKCLKRKRRFLIFSNDLQILNYTKMHIDNLKLLNPYKIRGLKDLKYEIKMKKGKKQSKK